MKRQIILFCIVMMNVHIGFALSEVQRWALALTEIMAEVTHNWHDTLNFNELNERNKTSYMEMLVRDWDVHNPKELLDVCRAKPR